MADVRTGVGSPRCAIHGGEDEKRPEVTHMFEITIGPQTTRVECPLLETMAATVAATAESLDELHSKVNELLAGQGSSQPYIKFTIGPVGEKE
jgi:hypothetical protein